MEFRSKLEDLMSAEELMFGSTPGFGSYKRFLEHAIAHPAKMNTKLLRFLIENFTSPEETVLDPMCGSGSTGVVAALHGRNAVQVDIEEKFVDWAEEARLKVEKQATLAHKGFIKNIRGDSRKLSELLNQADVCITSPPYAKTISKQGGPSRITDIGVSCRTAREYSDNPENIANLPHGSVDAVITSPPYGEAQDGHGIAKEGYRGSKHSPTDLVGNRSYMPDKFESPQNISKLPLGNVDAVITSPPYSESNLGGGDPDKRKERLLRAGHNPEEFLGGKARNAVLEHYPEVDTVITSPPYGDQEVGKGIRAKRWEKIKNREGFKGRKEWKTGTPCHYSDEKENIGNLPFADVVITSPPYEAGNIRDISKEPYGSKLVGGAKRNIKQVKPYSDRKDNIGNLQKETYLEAMLTCYKEMWKVLKPNGLCIIVIKPFIRNKKVVDLPWHTWLLLEKVGFKLKKLYKLRLQQESFWRILYHKKHPTVEKIRHEYVLVTQKPISVIGE